MNTASCLYFGKPLFINIDTTKEKEGMEGVKNRLSRVFLYVPKLKSILSHNFHTPNYIPNVPHMGKAYSIILTLRNILDSKRKL